MKDRELYGIDLQVILKSPSATYPMAVRLPGWVNFGILRTRAVPIEMQLIKSKRRAS